MTDPAGSASIRSANAVLLACLIVVFVVSLIPRALDLGAFISPDEPRWLENTLSFREGLVTGDLSKLYQQPHPGITTMWVSAATITSESWGTRRLPHAVAISVLITVAAYLLPRRGGGAAGLGGGLLLALDPHFIAHSRVLAMDALLSIFLIISLLALLVGLKERKWYWLALSGTAGALAVLSKMIGVAILPVVAVALVVDWLQFHMKKVPLPAGSSSAAQVLLKTASAWVGAAVITALIVFPAVITDFAKVAAGTREFFATEHYSQQVHALGPHWYVEAFKLWTTPLVLILLFVAMWLFALGGKYRFPLKRRNSDVGILLLFFGLFLFTIQYSIKKGDRYMLPASLILDVLTALAIVVLWKFYREKLHRGALAALVVVLLGWQVWNLFQLHPHYLAYRNPFFRSVAEGRTMGWGEGLDLAADYLNWKPGAEEMLVLSYWEGQLGYKFKGEVTGVERLAKETMEEVGADYVVLYRAMQGRAPDRWETKVLAQFASVKPEHVISLNGEEYVWIYRVK